MAEGVGRVARIPAPPANIRRGWRDRRGMGAGVRLPVDRLVDRAREGDAEAFGELYRMYHGAIYRAVRHRLGGTEGVEDAVAETFVRAWAALPRYRRRGVPFVAWLYGIARHVALDEIARRRRVWPVAEASDRPAAGGAGGEEDDRVDLSRALARLPEEQRQVLEMRFFLGLSNAEVGAVLGRTPGAVNALQWRALRMLRGLLQEEPA